MFLIFVNELIWLLDKYGVKVKLFADDMKLYLRIVNRGVRKQIFRTNSLPFQ